MTESSTYIEVYDQEGKLISREPYEVSPEVLERDTLLKTLDELLKKGKANWTLEDLKTLIEILIKLKLTGL